MPKAAAVSFLEKILFRATQIKQRCEVTKLYTIRDPDICS